MSEKNIILFTGQSGIRIKECLNKLSQGDKIISVDERMEKISNKSFKEEILAAPPYVQERLWSEALTYIETEELSKVERGKYLFLTFHASYYHQKKTEFLSPVNLTQLQKLKDKIKMMIVLIDDIYDIYLRLMDKGQMYEYIMELEDPLRALIESIINLVSILSWREMEIAFSRKIAQFLGDVPLYIISVKHPSFMVSRLIRKPSTEVKVAYLSHPITDIRASHLPRYPEFYGELQEFIKRVIQKEENIVVFIPDSIDEKRIRTERRMEKEEKKERLIYIPELLVGWPLPFSDRWLHIPIPPHLKDLNPLNPKNFDFFNAKEEIKSAISSILQILDTKVTAQINSRDRSLIEASNILLVYRPYWAGSIPSGVEEEIKYMCELRSEYNDKDRKIIMLTAVEDLGRLQTNALFREIKNNIILDPESKQRLVNLFQQWLSDSKLTLRIGEGGFDKNEMKEAIESRLSTEYEFKPRYLSFAQGALGFGKMLGRIKKREDVGRKSGIRFLQVIRLGNI
ncbi:hypothetical protein J7K70_02255 [bacterium]|nr:hypothetical protein [bacterium]